MSPSARQKLFKKREFQTESAARSPLPILPPRRPGAPAAGRLFSDRGGPNPDGTFYPSPSMHMMNREPLPGMEEFSCAFA